MKQSVGEFLLFLLILVLVLVYCDIYRVSPKIRPSLKIRPRSNFKNDFNLSPALKVRRIR